jgi:hypothetical protein
VDAVAVEVASGSVVVLGGAGVGVTGEDLGVAERDTGIKGVGDCSVGISRTMPAGRARPTAGTPTRNDLKPDGTPGASGDARARAR